MELTYEIDVPMVVKEYTKIDSTEIEPIREVIIMGKINPNGLRINGLTIKFFVNTTDEQEARGLAEGFLQHLKRVLYFEEHKIINWWNLESVKKEMNDETYFRHSDILTMLDVVNIMSSYNDIDHLKTSLTKINQYQKPFGDLYMTISQIEGNIGKYIMTYSILSALIGKQKKVDNFIKEHESNVEIKNSSLQGSNKKETIYTYLRNQIGHTEESSKADNLEIEIKKHLSKLSEFAKKAILNE